MKEKSIKRARLAALTFACLMAPGNPNSQIARRSSGELKTSENHLYQIFYLWFSRLAGERVVYATLLSQTKPPED
jgi:hypothetical protein